MKSMPSVAVIGASNDRNKFGNKAVRAFRQRGYIVYPVNRTEAEIEGLTAYRSVTDIVEAVDLISVYVRPQILLSLLPEIASKSCRELWLNPGTESEEVLVEAARLKLPVIQACSIVAMGLSPHSL